MTQWNDPQGRPPRYDQPTTQYGAQPPYGAPPGRHDDPQRNPFGTAGDQAFGIASIVLTLLGGIVLVVSFTTLEWFKGSVTFGDISDAVDAGGSATGFGEAYFDWLAWTFFIVGLVAAIVASFPSPALRAVRAIGAVVGFAAAGLTFLAIDPGDNGSYGDAIGDARIGFYFAVVGFLLIGIGAAIGPRKV